MEDVLYPDNPKREARLYELAADIGSLMNDLSKDAEEIKRLLENLDKKIREMYRSIEVDIPPSNTKKFEYKGWIADVFETLEPLIFFKPIESALKEAAVMSLRNEGRIGEAAFYDALSIGLDRLTWLKVGVEAGAIAAVVALDLLIAGGFGAEKRTKLRDAIHSAIQPRIKLKKAAIINGMLREKLQTVVDTCDTLKELGFTKDQLDQAQKNVSDKFREEVSKITEETAKSALAGLDKNRKSWTDEDN